MLSAIITFITCGLVQPNRKNRKALAPAPVPGVATASASAIVTTSSPHTSTGASPIQPHTITSELKDVCSSSLSSAKSALTTTASSPLTAASPIQDQPLLKPASPRPSRFPSPGPSSVSTLGIAGSASPFQNQPLFKRTHSDASQGSTASIINATSVDTNVKHSLQGIDTATLAASTSATVSSPFVPASPLHGQPGKKHAPSKSFRFSVSGQIAASAPQSDYSGAGSPFEAQPLSKRAQSNASQASASPVIENLSAEKDLKQISQTIHSAFSTAPTTWTLPQARDSQGALLISGPLTALSEQDTVLALQNGPRGRLTQQALIDAWNQRRDKSKDKYQITDTWTHRMWAKGKLTREELKKQLHLQLDGNADDEAIITDAHVDEEFRLLSTYVPWWNCSNETESPGASTLQTSSHYAAPASLGLGSMSPATSA